MIEKRYIGDAVYVEHDGYHVVLTTSDGIRDTNRICLEPSVVASMLDWLAELKQAIFEANNPKHEQHENELAELSSPYKDW